MQDDTLDLLTDSGTCRTCGVRGALCTLGQCPRCHTAGRHTPRTRGLWRGQMWPQAVELCCGWWGTLDVLPWTCPTCGAVRRHA
jgi:rubrerythrin